ncbi:amphoterin-induced protein 3 [Antennarius striatus]|uniref:amphoterin-induced protein 3 n=1 Tax=Antennarius striatus TaxID=241820 RepID=UPI0035AF43F1
MWSLANGGFLQGAGAPCWPVLLLVCLLLLGPAPSCRSQRPLEADPCVCTSDILSCGSAGLDQVPRDLPPSAVTLDLSHNRIVRLGGGSFQGLPRLETLRLAHNRLTTIHQGAFNTSRQLRHLDLSSNRLRALGGDDLAGLSGLEELLLFNNRIARVEGGALAGLGRLRRLYLSHNRLTDFPFVSMGGHGAPQLSLLDLSSNRLPRLPLRDLGGLPAALQRGLYLHNNSLRCDCSMWALFRRWEGRGYPPVRDFKRDHTCLLYGIRGGTLRFFLYDRYFDRCNLTAGNLLEQEGGVWVEEGASALLHCSTALRGPRLSFLWVSPRQEYVAPPGNGQSLRMFANGSLELGGARPEDSGTYWCLALDALQRRNDTHEVNVTVLPRPAGRGEAFNTGFTTLLGCGVSLLLVLVYLYLTPCRCPPCSATPGHPAAPRGRGNVARAGSAESSVLTPTPPPTTEGPGRKVSSNKHVVFLEPIREQNGRLRAGPVAGARHAHMGPLQRAAETDSIMSVFSDTPIMLP